MSRPPLLAKSLCWSDASPRNLNFLERFLLNSFRLGILDGLVVESGFLELMYAPKHKASFRVHPSPSGGGLRL